MCWCIHIYIHIHIHIYNIYMYWHVIFLERCISNLVDSGKGFRGLKSKGMCFSLYISSLFTFFIVCVYYVFHLKNLIKDYRDFDVKYILSVKA